MLTDQLINMIYLKRKPFDPSIAFRNLLIFETKACMQQSLGVMGASISSNTPKEVIASVISEHFRVNTEFVWSKLDNATKEILKQLAEGDSLTYVEHSHDETLFSEIEKSSLVVAFFPDRKKTACRYYMIDEVREVLKRVINDNTDISGFSDTPLPAPIDIEESPMHDFTSYGCSPSLIEDIRKAHYKKQAELCLTFCKLIKKLDKSWQNDMFIKRFMETSRNIDPHNLMTL